jgi:hypothetical protein
MMEPASDVVLIDDEKKNIDQHKAHDAHHHQVRVPCPPLLARRRRHRDEWDAQQRPRVWRTRHRNSAAACQHFTHAGHGGALHLTRIRYLLGHQGRVRFFGSRRFPRLIQG